MMLIIGLTGSIGMGKTTVGEYFAGQGIPVLDADSIVHRLYEGEAVTPIEHTFPGTTANGKVDRAKLSKAVMMHPNGFRRLEALVHPLVVHEKWEFVKACHEADEPMCVIDTPLLFEAGGEELVDVIVVASAPEDVQTERVMQRPGMTTEKLDAIMARQLSDAEKRNRADFVIDTGLPWEETLQQLDELLESLKSCEGDAYDRWLTLY
ncbi:MAG: dephospho-CoA kinase [Alphaproteobacteria bacterium]